MVQLCSAEKALILVDTDAASNQEYELQAYANWFTSTARRYTVFFVLIFYCWPTSEVYFIVTIMVQTWFK